MKVILLLQNTMKEFKRLKHLPLSIDHFKFLLYKLVDAQLCKRVSTTEGFGQIAKQASPDYVDVHGRSRPAPPRNLYAEMHINIMKSN